MNIDVSNLKKVNNDYKYRTTFKKYSEEEQSLLQTMELLNKIFTYNLKYVNKDALNYLKDRGVTDKIVDDLSLGFIPKGQLLNIMDKRKEISSSALLKLGLLRQDDFGNYYEVFQDRVSIPIKDEKGNIVSFAGRTMGDEKPKYLHTPETDFFHKKELLYNFDNAKVLSYNNELILVEGYLDVAGAKKLGFENTVALMGVALTEEHLKLITSNHSSIVFALDNDQAGINAMVEKIPELLDKNIRVSVIDISKLGDYKDFGDLLKEDLTFLDVQKVKMSGFHFLLDHKYFKDLELNSENIYYTYQKLKEDNLIKNTFDESLFIEYLLSNTSYTKTDIDKIIYPKSIEPSISPFANRALNNFLYNQVKMIIESKDDKVLLDYFNQNQSNIENELGTIFSNNNDMYLKDDVLDAEILLKDFLKDNQDYHNYESLNRFIYTNVFDNSYIKNKNGEIRVALTNEQKQKVIKQFEESLTDKEKLSLEEVEDLYIVNSVEDLDGILPYESKAMNMLRENLKDNMHFHQNKMSFFKYGNLFPNINKDFIDSRFKGKTGNYKTILLYNNLNNNLELTKGNLTPTITSIEQSEEKDLEQSKNKEYRFSVNKVLLVNELETDTNYFVRVPYTGAKEYFYIPKEKCEWHGDIFYTTLKADETYKIYDRSGEFLYDKSYFQLTANWDDKNKDKEKKVVPEKLEKQHNIKDQTTKSSSEFKEPVCKVFSSRIYLDSKNGFYIKTADKNVLLFADKKICKWNDDKSYLIITPRKNMWLNTGISKYKLDGFKKEFEKKLSFKEIDKYLKVFYPINQKQKSDISFTVDKQDCNFVSNFIRIPCTLNKTNGYIDINMIKAKESNDKKSFAIKLSEKELLSFHNADNKYINHYEASQVATGYKEFKNQEKTQEVLLEREVA